MQPEINGKKNEQLDRQRKTQKEEGCVKVRKERRKIEKSKEWRERFQLKLTEKKERRKRDLGVIFLIMFNLAEANVFEFSS